MNLLLDEHIWPGLPGLVRKFLPGATVASVHTHMSGALMNRPDAVVLAEARRAGLVLVTFDVNTFPALLREMAVSGEDHNGVVFVSSKAFAQNDHAGLARALAALMRAHSGTNWINRVVYLTREDRT